MNNRDAPIIDVAELLRPAVRANGPDPDVFALRVKDDSLSGVLQLCEGDRLIVDSTREAKHDDLVVIQKGDREHSLRRLVETFEGNVLRAFNSTIPDELVSRTRLRLRGVVIGALRIYRTSGLQSGLQMQRC